VICTLKHVYQETVKESELFAKEILMFVPEIYKIGVFTVHFGAVEAYQLATLSNEQLKTVSRNWHVVI